MQKAKNSQAKVVTPFITTNSRSTQSAELQAQVEKLLRGIEHAGSVGSNEFIFVVTWLIKENFAFFGKRLNALGIQTEFVDRGLGFWRFRAWTVGQRLPAAIALKTALPRERTGLRPL